MNNDSMSGASVGTPSSKKSNRVAAYSVIILLILFAVFLVAFIVYKLNHKTATVSTMKQAIVQVTAGGFVPSTLTIGPNTTIVWRNIDHSSHTIASNPYPSDSSLPGLHSKSLLPNGTYSYTPTSSQTITYHDDQNPSFNGTIIIKK